MGHDCETGRDFSGLKKPDPFDVAVLAVLQDRPRLQQIETLGGAHAAADQAALRDRPRLQRIETRSRC